MMPVCENVDISQVTAHRILFLLSGKDKGKKVQLTLKKCQ